MITYAARAVPWRLVLGCCALAAGLMAIVALWPRTMWPLQGTTVGLLAAAAAWSIDEPAATVVDALPRTLAWRTAARALAATPLAAVWTACVLLSGDRLPGHAALFLLQGLAAMLLALAWPTARRSRGSGSPGARFASVALPLAAMLALTRPFEDHVPLFPIWSYERWALSLALWSAMAIGAIALLAVTLIAQARPSSQATGSRR